VDEAKRSGDPETLAPAYATLYAIYLAAGRDSYRTLGALALHSYVEIGDLSGQAQCTNNLAVEALEDNRWVEAATTFARAADLYRRLGDTGNEATAIGNHAEVLVNQGRCDEAVPLLDDALEIARSVQDDLQIALVLKNLGRARSRSGDPAAGLPLLKEARATLEKIDEPDEAVLADLAIAEATLLGGNLDGTVHMTGELLTNEAAAHVEADLRALRGLAFLGLRRSEEAAVEFRQGAPAGRASGRAFGYALNCLGLSRAGAEDAALWEDRGLTTLRQLGVVALPMLDKDPL
jgi:tetratricopeptide (TPR) repeat protein